MSIPTLVLLMLAGSGAAHATALSQADPPLTGTVVDSSGAPIPGAEVRVNLGGERVIVIETAADGQFAIDIPAGQVTITVSASGFATLQQPVAMPTAPLRLVLHPAVLFESVTVTASRGAERLETAGSTTVLTSAEVLNTAAGAIDDTLRHTPGFSLFRRASSRVANPTTQGVTLRGVSGSGASRTLVLADGLPLNDAFGSWVYWNKIPVAAIERIEVVRGAAGDLYGADALGGVIQILTFAPGRPRLRASVDGGSHDTRRASVYAGGARRGWTGTAAGEWLRTDGVHVVAASDRGPVDVRADSDYQTAYGTLGYDTGAWRAHARASVYGEDRSNGTPRQVNRTDWRQLSGEAAGVARGGTWLARVSGGTQDYFQTFSAVADDRATERLTNEQTTPSSFVRAGGQWVQPWRSHVLLAGAEGQRARSFAHEQRFTFFGAPLPLSFFGGTEVSGAVFGRASLAAGRRVTVVLGARGDFWNSEPRNAAGPEHSVSFFSPRASLAWQATDRVAVRTSAYVSHRTPTLNELHRGFRVGNVVTTPNPLLEPETLKGVEGSVLLSARRVSARVTGFWNVLDDAIANITQSVTPALITRQRQNADRIRSGGVELEVDFRPHPTLVVNALAVFTGAHFAGTPQQPDLDGNRVPQVPAYQFGAGLTYADPRRLTLSAQLRVLGSQFDDDRNLFELESFAVLDAYASRALGRRLHVFAAVENVFDTEYDVGRTPVRTIGWPRTARAGVRVFLP